jgi:hypothetical protein
METISGLTTSFEAPQPFTYPRYSLDLAGHLVAQMPSIGTANELRSALANHKMWAAFVKDLAAKDAFYTRTVFVADVFDYSVIGRMVRRAWGQRTINNRTAAMRPAADFAGAPDISTVLRAILADFGMTVRATGGRPIVVLIEDRGYGNTLSDIAIPALRANHIEFIATSRIVAPEDSGNFISDGHFTSRANENIARVLLQVIQAP